jgi:2-keto-4-pentenoate hydratase
VAWPPTPSRLMVVTSGEALVRAASRLAEAEETGHPIPPLVDDLPGLSIDDAYEIQMRNVQRRVAEGGTIRGHKVGLTAKAMQDMLGVNEPDFGHLFADMFIESGSEVAPDRYIAPRVEPEVAFLLGADLPTEGCTPSDVLEATESIAASLEIIDSRVRDWKITLADTVADNASSAGVVLGKYVKLESAIDLARLSVEVVVDGRKVETGESSAVMGHPANAVAWLANTLGKRGVALERGHVIMPGSCTKAIDVQKGETVTATFDALPAVTVSFR